MYVNKILLLTLFSVAFTQELKVEGNLNVTGAVINDSLVQVIDSLKVDIALHQSLHLEQQAIINQLQIQINSLYEQLAFIAEGNDLYVDCNNIIGGDGVLELMTGLSINKDERLS